MKLYGDSLHYFGNEEKAYLYGNVKLITNQVLLNANSLIYDQQIIMPITMMEVSLNIMVKITP